MIISFTGTSNRPLSEEQRDALYLLLKDVSEVHHGDCINSDSDFQDVVEIHNTFASIKYEGIEDRIKVFLHPCTITKKRAFRKGDVIFKPKPPMERNMDLAKVCDILLATPLTDKEELRSGTWSAIRRAKKLGKKVVLILENGTTKEI